MHNEFTAIIEKDNDWYIAYCAEIDTKVFQLAVNRFKEYAKKLKKQPRLLEEKYSYGGTNGANTEQTTTDKS